MFPPSREELENDIKIQYTGRIMPEDQNSGGFYVALMRKNKATKFPVIDEPANLGEITEAKEENNEEIAKNEEDNVNEEAKDSESELLGTKREEHTEVPTDIVDVDKKRVKPEKGPNMAAFKLLQEKDQAKYEPVDAEVWEDIRHIYGIGPAFPAHLLAVPNGQGKKIYILSLVKQAGEELSRMVDDCETLAVKPHKLVGEDSGALWIDVVGKDAALALDEFFGILDVLVEHLKDLHCLRTGCRAHIEHEVVPLDIEE